MSLRRKQREALIGDELHDLTAATHENETWKNKSDNELFVFDSDISPRKKARNEDSAGISRKGLHCTSDSRLIKRIMRHSAEDNVSKDPVENSINLMRQQTTVAPYKGKIHNAVDLWADSNDKLSNIARHKEKLRVPTSSESYTINSSGSAAQAKSSAPVTNLITSLALKRKTPVKVGFSDLTQSVLHDPALDPPIIRQSLPYNIGNSRKSQKTIRKEKHKKMLRRIKRLQDVQMRINKDAGKIDELLAQSLMEQPKPMIMDEDKSFPLSTSTDLLYESLKRMNRHKFTIALPKQPFPVHLSQKRTCLRLSSSSAAGNTIGSCYQGLIKEATMKDEKTIDKLTSHRKRVTSRRYLCGLAVKSWIRRQDQTLFGMQNKKSKHIKWRKTGHADYDSDDL